MSDEKVPVDLDAADLNKIDKLVAQGHYTDRAEFVRLAVEALAQVYPDQPAPASTRQVTTVGVLRYSRDDLERARAAGTRLSADVTGALVIAGNVSPELASETIESIRLQGVLHAKKRVKEALSDRIIYGS